MFHLPPDKFVYTQTFMATDSWQIYNVPEGVAMIMFVGFGSGAGGGVGRSGANTTNRPGAGGGGSAATTTLIIPAELLPKTLFVQVPIGSTGSGSRTIVNVAPDDSSNTFSIFRSNNNVNASDGGNALSGSAGPGGGAAQALTGNTAGRYSNLGCWYSTSGQTGAAGGNATAGTNVTPDATYILTSGAGGAGVGIGGTDADGGSVLVSGFMPLVSGGAAGTNDGDPSTPINKPYVSSGAGGGSAANNGNGGRGGNAGPGGGGGGGGGGIAGGTEGRGGDGRLWIFAW